MKRVDSHEVSLCIKPVRLILIVCRRCVVRRTACLILFLLAACAGLWSAPIAGVLTDLNKKPVAGATVYSFLLGVAEGKHCTPKAEASAVTDIDGRYSLGELPDLTKDQYRYLVAYLPGKYIGWTMQSPSMAEMERFLGKPRALIAAPAVSKTGRVVDQSGRPMANVPIKYLGLRIQKAYPMFLSSEILDILHISTNLTSRSDGSYTITDAAADADVLVVPRKKGFAVKNASVNPADLRIVLVPSGRMEGLIQDAAGRPLQGVDVMVCQRDYCPDSVTTDARGRFVVADLSPGTWSVSAHARGHMFTSIRNVSVRAAKTTLLSPISELPMAKVSGEVTYADTGRPAQGVHVMISPMAQQVWTENKPSVSDANGAFKTDAAVGKGVLNVVELPSGYVEEEPYTEITVPKTGLSGVKIRLVKAEIGRGRVVDASGQPVAGASVSFYMEGGEPGRTGADGSFALTLPRPDIQGGHSPFAANTLALLVRQGEQKLGAIELVSRNDLLSNKVSIIAKPMASAKVHVVLPSGKPAVGARVSELTILASDGGSSSYSNLSDISTDAHGNAAVSDLKTGASYSITASLPGFFDSGKRPRIELGTTIPSVINIKLQLATRVQKGKVIDENGKPVAGAEVSVEAPGTRTLASTETDATGHFTLRGLPDSAVNLSASKNNHYASMVVSKFTGAVVLQIVRQEF
jgi:hypothetical protein